MKESTTAGYLTAERKVFHDITERLMNVNLEVLSALTKQMTDGERVQPETEQEKLCFKLINDLDHVNGHVSGSITQKKYMRNEIWSLISYFGAPSWFITFSPADNMHPISLYFADTQETFSPELRPDMSVIDLYLKTQLLVLNFSILWLKCLSNMCWEWVKIILDYIVRLQHIMVLLSSKED